MLLGGIMKKYESHEKDMTIKGTVIDDPYYVTYFQAANAKFLMELGQDVTATTKGAGYVTLHQGEAVVVVGTGGCYIRKNDQIEIKGRILKLVLDDRARGESIYILADRIYNETLRFSFNY